ncbi:MAG: TIR-like domain-containing protein [Cytophagia bacterium]|nr:MAG: TIR-like domain-containing protein [Runella sp.]TAG22497.1 MAG: TIR-like domain-containing protein [Cytophagales bacterium]TAG41532.1 MAG: TIR-like domain-containing protein [Cytophagia bacterium]TAG83349.1 MAG: TIR-like domain-containing protein [Cytophagales bacterium]
MVRRVFFSFHYENDVWIANIVRNSWVTKPNTETAGFIDAADFEEVKKGGDSAIKRWIDNQLNGTSVTVVLIGAETSNREYVKYELEKSYARGNGIVPIYIHKVKGRNGYQSSKGSNTFGEIGKDKNGNSVYLSVNYPIYDWIDDNGYNNLGKWVEEAAKKAGR